MTPEEQAAWGRRFEDLRSAISVEHVSLVDLEWSGRGWSLLAVREDTALRLCFDALEGVLTIEERGGSQSEWEQSAYRRYKRGARDEPLNLAQERIIARFRS